MLLVMLTAVFVWDRGMPGSSSSCRNHLVTILPMKWRYHRDVSHQQRLPRWSVFCWGFTSTVQREELIKYLQSLPVKDYLELDEEQSLGLSSKRPPLVISLLL